MFTEKNNAYYIKIILKIILSVGCYLVFTLYTVPTYHNVRAYVDEKFIDKRSIIIGETALVVDVADESQQQERGLGGRTILTEGTGMLFVYSKSDIYSVWMKNMHFNIDVMWFNEYGELVYYMQDLSPDTYPYVFSPTQKSKYIIEVPAGFIKQEGIKLGDKIDLY